MVSRLTVFFYIVLCLLAGVFLIVIPWVGGGSFWGDNYFLVLAARKVGSAGLQRAVASGWARGAVTGLGLLNIALAFWEIFHFGDSVRRLEGGGPQGRAVAAAPRPTQAQTPLPPPQAHYTDDAARATQADNLSHHER